MKKIYFITVLFSAIIFIAHAQETSCRYGFSYEISNSPHWGKDKPVITAVNPGSPAERAEIKPFDVITAVEGIAVTDSVLDDIHLFLNPPGKDVVELTIRNFSGTRNVKVKKECVSVNALNENQLASAFAMYAVEYTHERLFTCPFVTNQTSDKIDFSEFKSFDFAGDTSNQPDLAKQVNALIKKELTGRGLKYDPVAPDLRVQIYYSFNKNPNYKPRPVKKTSKKAAAEETPTEIIRYDTGRDRMVRLPFLPPGTIETEAEYLLQMGFRLEDRKISRGRIVWECEANELLNQPYALGEFASIHIPLMALQFPYAKYGRNVQYRLVKKKYNYTGINYNIDNLQVIASVDLFSPAAKAGVKQGDIIEFIEDKRADRTSQQFTLAYRRFLINTIKLRDNSTRFVDANGFPDCMEWDKSKYEKVKKAFANKNNLTIYAYLYWFAPFINPMGNNSLSFKIIRDKEKLEYVLRPEIRSECILMVE